MHFFCSCISYSLLLRSFTTRNNIEKIFTIQQRCLHLMSFSHLSQSMRIINSLKIMTLEDMLKFKILKLICFLYNNRLPTILSNSFQQSLSSSIYSNHLLLIPKTSTSQCGTNFLQYNGLLCEMNSLEAKVNKFT